LSENRDRNKEYSPTFRMSNVYPSVAIAYMPYIAKNFPNSSLSEAQSETHTLIESDKAERKVVADRASTLRRQIEKLEGVCRICSAILFVSIVVGNRMEAFTELHVRQIRVFISTFHL
jgi:hypothetical protein